MHDDLRRIVENDLARLAYQIMRPVRDIPDSTLPSHRFNFVRRGDWAWADRECRLVYAGAEGDNGYLYRIRDNEGDDLTRQWFIIFSDVRMIDIDRVDPQPIDVNPGEIELVSVGKQTNNGAGIEKLRTSRKEAHARSKEHSFRELLEAEFSLSIKRTAEAGIRIAKGSEEITASFRQRAEFEANQAWSSSDSIEDAVEREYPILPYSSLEVLVKRGTPNIRQVTHTWGKLECTVYIEIYNSIQHTFDNLDDLIQVFRGLRGGYGGFSPHFARHSIPDSEINQWPRPRIRLDLETRGKRVRYGEIVKNEFPIPGKEREFERGKRQYYRSLG